MNGILKTPFLITELSFNAKLTSKLALLSRNFEIFIFWFTSGVSANFYLTKKNLLVLAETEPSLPMKCLKIFELSKKLSKRNSVSMSISILLSSMETLTVCLLGEYFELEYSTAMWAILRFRSEPSLWSINEKIFLSSFALVSEKLKMSNPSIFRKKLFRKFSSNEN
jgi:hypothetical protein